MTRILMLVGVAAVAGAMYVAAASGGQQSRGPSTKQFNALKTQFNTLKKQYAILNAQVGNVNQSLDTVENDDAQTTKEAALAASFISGCFLNSDGSFRFLPVSQFGSTSTGYLFGTSSSSATPRSALDIDPSPGPMAYLQEVNPACIIGITVVHSGTSRLQRWAERTR